MDVECVISFGYARHALIGVLTAAGLVPGDEIILSPLTCKVVPLALLSMGLSPVYVDIDASTLNLKPDAVASAIRPSTRAVVFQHTYGDPAGAEEVAHVASRRGLFLVEDCAQCLPSAANDYAPGKLGHAAIFSNNLLKPLPAGSGGIAVTNDKDLAVGIEAFRNRLPQPGRIADVALRAQVWIHRHVLRPSLYWPALTLFRSLSPRYKLRSLDEQIHSEIIASAFQPSAYQLRAGLRSLSHLKSNAAHRRRCCDDYQRGLERTGASRLRPEASLPLLYYPILTDSKEHLLRRTQARNIEIIAWPTRTPIYPIDHLEDLIPYGYTPGACPVAEDVAKRLVGLPTHGRITSRVRKRIIRLLLDEDQRTKYGR